MKDRRPDRTPSEGYVPEEVKHIMQQAIIEPSNPDDIKEMLMDWAVPEVNNMLADLETAGYVITKE